MKAGATVGPGPFEFPIWGKPPGVDVDTLLHTTCKTAESAESVALELHNVHGCTDIRIQTLNMGPDGPGELANVFRGVAL